MKTIKYKVFRVHYKSPCEERYVLVAGDSFKDAIDIFESYMGNKPYEITDITTNLDAIKPITITVEL